MTEHNIVRILDCTVVCSCREQFSASSLEQAKKNHLYHRGLAMARANLEEGVKGG